MLTHARFHKNFSYWQKNSPNQWQKKSNNCLCCFGMLLLNWLIPWDGSGHHLSLQSKEWIELWYQAFPLLFFLQRGEDEFHFNRRIRNACLKLSPVYAVNLCHCFVNYRIVRPSIDRTNGFVLLMRSFASLCHKTFRMPCFNIATERPRLLYLKLKAIGQRLHGQSAVV